MRALCDQKWQNMSSETYGDLRILRTNAVFIVCYKEKLFDIVLQKSLVYRPNTAKDNNKLQQMTDEALHSLAISMLDRRYRQRRLWDGHRPSALDSAGSREKISEAPCETANPP